MGGINLSLVYRRKRAQCEVQIRIAESDKKVAEMAWRDASEALSAAKASRRQAERNWQEVKGPLLVSNACMKTLTCTTCHKRVSLLERCCFLLYQMEVCHMTI
jgi:hypothetical protein